MMLAFGRWLCSCTGIETRRIRGHMGIPCVGLVCSFRDWISLQCKREEARCIRCDASACYHQSRFHFVFRLANHCRNIRWTHVNASNDSRPRKTPRLATYLASQV